MEYNKKKQSITRTQPHRQQKMLAQQHLQPSKIESELCRKKNKLTVELCSVQLQPQTFNRRQWEQKRQLRPKWMQIMNRKEKQNLKDKMRYQKLEISKRQQHEKQLNKLALKFQVDNWCSTHDQNAVPPLELFDIPAIEFVALAKQQIQLPQSLSVESTEQDVQFSKHRFLQPSKEPQHLSSKKFQHHMTEQVIEVSSEQQSLQFDTTANQAKQSKKDSPQQHLQPFEFEETAKKEERSKQRAKHLLMNDVDPNCDM
jgi:hypothetical protein